MIQRAQWRGWRNSWFSANSWTSGKSNTNIVDCNPSINLYMNTVSLLKLCNFWRSCFLSLQSPRFHRSLTYILKADPATQTAPQKNLNFPQICPKMPQNGPKMAKNDPKWSKMAQIWPKMAQNGPRMTQNDPKWPKNDPKWPKMNQNGQKWPKMAQSGPNMTQNGPKWP